MKTLKHRQLYWLIVSILVIALDQFSKWLAYTHLAMHDPMPLLPFFNLTLSHNMGAAFGFLGTAGGWQRWFFIILGIALSALILVWLYRLPRNQPWNACAFALILGGALGNIYDRVAWGYVVDFFDFHINTWHYATFNVADSAICIGITMWLIVSLKTKK